jgi:hypothetical protein
METGAFVEICSCQNRSLYTDHPVLEAQIEVFLAYKVIEASSY